MGVDAEYWNVVMFVYTAIALIAAFGAAGDGNMIPVTDHYCASKNQGGEFCNEWLLRATPSIHFIVDGMEDGAEYSFYRVSARSEYRQLVQIEPIVTRSKKHEYSFAEDFSDIALTKNLQLQATFAYPRFASSGVIKPMLGQQRTPLVLFIGKNEPDSDTPPAFSSINLKSISLDELVKQARSRE